MDRYHYWLNDSYFDQETKDELKGIAGDAKEIEDRFYKDLEFGTGGLRGVIGAGTNRMNKYVVRRATQGLANYIRKEAPDGASVVIAHDSRYRSREFAEQAALVLAGNGIKAFLFPELKPTPMLSYAVRYLKCTAGIVITASHNPPEYNGYKVYWQDGGQIVPSLADKITAEIARITDYGQVKTASMEEARAEGLVALTPVKVDESYFREAKALLDEISAGTKAGRAELRVVYTPLHGTGNIPVRRLLRDLGFKNVLVVPEQEHPDPEFSTVSYPNPEDAGAFELALKLAREHQADIAVATDPDCDRVGVFVRTAEGDYQSLSGNQTGALILHYILSRRKESKSLPGNGVVIKTIVTSELGKRIAASYGIEIQNTLTGFKYIGEKIKQFEEAGDKAFLFGYEESYGYLVGTFARDKDAVTATALACCLAADCRDRGITLLEVLEGLYKKHGYFRESLKTLTLKGVEGVRAIEAIMKGFRNDPPREIAGHPIAILSDYLVSLRRDLLTGTESPLTLPRENVLHFAFEDDSWFCIRPSGTEPKIKIYFSAVGDEPSAAEEFLKKMESEVMERIQAKSAE